MMNSRLDRLLQRQQIEHLKGGRDHASGLYTHSKPVNNRITTISLALFENCKFHIQELAYVEKGL